MFMVLLHSPLVGPSTWRPVAERWAVDGATVLVPDLRGVATGPPPYERSALAAVRAALPERGDIVLVAHSNAALYVPLLVAGLSTRVRCIVFVDARVPTDSASVPLGQAAMVEELAGRLDRDGLLPGWIDWWPADDVRELLPGADGRERIRAEQPTIPLRYLRHRLATPHGWSALPSGYLQPSAAYDTEASAAADRGWPVRRLTGGHLHQLVAPDQVLQELRTLLGSLLAGTYGADEGGTDRPGGEEHR